MGTALERALTSDVGHALESAEDDHLRAAEASGAVRCVSNDDAMHTRAEIDARIDLSPSKDSCA
jgi:hypothetical protein